MTPPTPAMVLDDLLRTCIGDRSKHAAALPIFQKAIATESDPLAVIKGAQGIELIIGLAAGQEAFVKLLKDSRPKVTAMAAMFTKDRRHVPELIAALDYHNDADCRSAIIRSLCRLRDPACLPAIEKLIPDPALRPHIAEALADIGDPAAVPLVRKLLDDRAEAWPEDNHGPMLRVCDIARQTLQRLTST